MHNYICIVTILILNCVYFTRSQFNLIPQIQACCGGTCQNFERADDLFGISCCGTGVYNTYSQLCCQSVIRERDRGGSYADQCCGNQVLRYDQTCCNGIVHNVVNGECCGQAVFLKSDKNFLCCNSTLVRRQTSSDLCCGAQVFDGNDKQICCGEQVFEKTNFDQCCENEAGTFLPYKASLQFCCNGPAQRNSGIACCHLIQNGRITRATYNIQTQCCRFPFLNIHPKSPNEDC